MAKAQAQLVKDEQALQTAQSNYDKAKEALSNDKDALAKADINVIKAQNNYNEALNNYDSSVKNAAISATKHIITNVTDNGQNSVITDKFGNTITSKNGHVIIRNKFGKVIAEYYGNVKITADGQILINTANDMIVDDSGKFICTSGSQAQQLRIKDANIVLPTENGSHFKPSAVSAATLPGVKSLPKTDDNNDNHGIIAGIMALLAGILGMFNLTKIKRRHN